MVSNPTAYAERIRRVADYLAGHLDEELDLETLARVACFSPYHFHRIYRGLLGETVNETVRRLRLNRAAIDLLDGELSIERTARRAGYSSQAAFTRAFRAEYGEPPARFRGRPEAGSGERAPYRVELVDLPTLRVATIEHRGDYRLANKSFERLMTIAATTGLLTPATRTIGIYHDDPEAVPEPELRSAACITVPDGWAPTRELKEGRIEAGRYARIVHTGPYTELETAYDWLYRSWLPASACDPRDLPCLEEYLNDPRQVPAKDLETAVLLPVVA
ncbi:MAG TPA: GyrI-like domain-containing protein [Gammaproteobacteria bacterium]|jgi:AraC family transcriptional regulator